MPLRCARDPAASLQEAASAGQDPAADARRAAAPQEQAPDQRRRAPVVMPFPGSCLRVITIVSATARAPREMTERDHAYGAQLKPIQDVIYFSRNIA